MLPTKDEEKANAVAIAVLETKLGDMAKDLDEIKVAVKELLSASARVKGGIFIVLMLGGIVGWLSTLGETFYKIWFPH